MKIGDHIKCARCGKDIVATGGTKKYCPECREAVHKARKAEYMADFAAKNPISLRKEIAERKRDMADMKKRLAERDAAYAAEFGSRGRIDRPFKFRVDQEFDECVRRFY